YDRPKNLFKLSDVRRILGKLSKPYVVLPQHAWTVLFSPIDGHFLGYLNEILATGWIDRYRLDDTEVPGMGRPVWWSENWPAELCRAIDGRRAVILVRSEWID
ncbi:unnamed protein product, partial [marine sediment metagenome]